MPPVPWSHDESSKDNDLQFISGSDVPTKYLHVSLLKTAVSQ
jgi:hypothetical protein